MYLYVSPLEQQQIIPYNMHSLSTLAQYGQNYRAPGFQENMLLSFDRQAEYQERLANQLLIQRKNVLKGERFSNY